RKVIFPPGSIEVREPSSAARLGGLLPGIEVGVGEDGAPFLVVAEQGGEVDEGERPIARLDRSGDRSAPAELRLSLRGLGELVIADATVALTRDAEAKETSHAEVCRLRVDGALVTDNLVELLLASGGFEDAGARAFLAERLGFTVATLPSKIPLRVVAEGREADG
ncbi:MAG: hypothetical protein R3B09_33535, partial [Nannocystaceae bacterium]